MPPHHDSADRPIVVVTGMGVVTSLGAGKAENWKNLTAGKSGIDEVNVNALTGKVVGKIEHESPKTKPTSGRRSRRSTSTRS